MRTRGSVLLITFIAVYALAQSSDTPAFHAQPPAKGQSLPAVLTEAQLIQRGIDDPAVLAAYRAAAKAPAALYQQPCYCHCDRSQGHTSLHSCFENLHGAGCGTCMQEALFAYLMSRKGWTARQIREAIMKGQYSSISLRNPPAVN
jgi:hypothetical protein